MDIAGHPYPAVLDIETPQQMARWRPLVQWILAIPHYIVLYALGIISNVIAVISWFVVLFTGKLPAGFAGIQAMYLRYENRVYAYAGFLLEDYPPFSFDTADADPHNYARETVDFQPQLEDRNRLTVLLRILLVIPQIIVLAILSVVAWILHLIAAIAVIITGRWPEGLRRFIVGYLRWSLRVNAYFLLLTDDYPPFALD